MAGRVFSWALFAAALGLIMRAWFSADFPLTVNSENLPEINYIWLLRNLFEQGTPFTGWHPKALAGEAVHNHFLYPLYWTAALVSLVSGITPPTLYKLMVYLVLLLGAIFTAEFVRRLTGSLIAGLAGGLIFCLIPGHMNTIEGFFIKISWMAVPLTLWLYEKYFGQAKTPQIKGAVLLGLAVGLMALASVQIPLMMSLILPPYIALREWQAASTSEAGRWHIWLTHRFKAWLVAAGITLGIMAWYYLPLLIELNHLAFSRFADFPSGGTITLEFLFYMLRARWFAAFSPENFHEVTWYLGGVAVLLALIGLASRYKQGVVIFFTAAGLLSLLLLVGDSLGPLPNVVYHTIEQIPVVKGVLRHSFRWVLPLSLSLAVLAGFGAASLTSRFKLSTGLRRYGAMILLAGLLTFDYSPLYASFRTTDNYLRESEMAAIVWLNQQDATYRYFAPFANGTPRTYHLVYSHHLIQRPAVWDDQYVSHFVSKRAYFFLVGLNVQLPDLPSGLLDPLFLQMLDLGAVRHVLIFMESYNHRDLFNTATGLGAPVVFEQDEVRILENRTARPLMQVYPTSALYLGDAADEEKIRAWLPRLTPNEIALIEGRNPGQTDTLKNQVDYLLLESENDLDRLTLTERSRAIWPEQAETLSPQLLVEHSVEWTRPHPARAEATVRLTQPATLVFAEAWYPGWHVYVNGVEQPLLRANYAFQGVALPAGEQAVVFEYRRPFYVWLGLGVSLVTLIAAAIILSRKQQIYAASFSRNSCNA